MNKFFLFVILVFFIQGCCTNHCGRNFAKTAKALFGEQITDSLRSGPKTARFFGNVLKGDTTSFVKTGSYVVEAGKGDLQSSKKVARVIREQWNESIIGLPKTLKIIGEQTCLYCDEKN